MDNKAYLQVDAGLAVSFNHLSGKNCVLSNLAILTYVSMLTLSCKRVCSGDKLHFLIQAKDIKQLR